AREAPQAARGAQPSRAQLARGPRGHARHLYRRAQRKRARDATRRPYEGAGRLRRRKKGHRNHEGIHQGVHQGHGRMGQGPQGQKPLRTDRLEVSLSILSTNEPPGLRRPSAAVISSLRRAGEELAPWSMNGYGKQAEVLERSWTKSPWLASSLGTTASWKSWAAGAWAWCTRRKTSSSAGWWA